MKNERGLGPACVSLLSIPAFFIFVCLLFVVVFVVVVVLFLLHFAPCQVYLSKRR